MDRLTGHTRRPKSTARLTEEREETASQGLLVFLSFLSKTKLPSPVATAISLATGLLPLLFAMLCDMNAAKSDSLENDGGPGSSTDFLDVHLFQRDGRIQWVPYRKQSLDTKSDEKSSFRREN